MLPARIYIVRLAEHIDLDIEAQTPEMACDRVRLMHPALGVAIRYVGLEDGDPQVVRGRCQRCETWVFSDDAWHGREQVVCKACRGRKVQWKPAQGVIPKEQKPTRTGGPRNDDGEGGREKSRMR